MLALSRQTMKKSECVLGTSFPLASANQAVLVKTSIRSDDEQEYVYSDDDYEYHMDDADKDVTTTSTTEEDSGMENELSKNDREQQPQPPLCG